MMRSGSSSPTFTESNSRSAIGKALSALVGTTCQGRVRLLHGLAPVVADDVLRDDDVGAVRLPVGVQVDVAVQPVADLDGQQKLQLLVHLDDLGVVNADVRVGEERRLGRVSE